MSQYCGAEIWVSSLAAIAIAINSIAASLFHYGGANHMYTRKSDQLAFSEEQRRMLMLGGILAFCVSIALGVQLPNAAGCVYILLFNAISIPAYSFLLSRHFSTKTITMVLISVTPLAIGWWAGKFTHSIFYWAVIFTALVHAARELDKDFMDRFVNHGIRFTLPMKLKDPYTVQRISGALLMLALLPGSYFWKFAGNPFKMCTFIIAVLVLFATSLYLFAKKDTGKGPTLIHVGLACALISLL
jgi:hypothetical protein